MKPARVAAAAAALCMALPSAGAAQNHCLSPPAKAVADDFPQRANATVRAWKERRLIPRPAPVTAAPAPATATAAPVRTRKVRRGPSAREVAGVLSGVASLISAARGMPAHNSPGAGGPGCVSRPVTGRGVPVCP